MIWLDLLKKESPRHKPLESSISRRKSELDTEEMCSIEREVSRAEGGAVELLCKVSAEYCVKCDTQETAKREAQFRAENKADRHMGEVLGNSPQAEEGRLVERRDTLQSGTNTPPTLTWDAIKHLQEIRARFLADGIGLDPRTIRNYVDDHKLDRTKRGYVRVNHKLSLLIREHSLRK